MSQTATPVQEPAIGREEIIKAHISELFRKQFGSVPARVNLVPYVDTSKDEKKVTIEVVLPPSAGKDDVATRTKAQRFAAMLAVAGNTDVAPQAFVRGASLSLDYSGTLDTLKELDPRLVGSETVRNTDIARMLLVPVLQQSFPNLQPGDVRVEERGDHVVINLNSSFRFKDRKSARDFTNALESGSGEQVLVNLNAESIGEAKAGDTRQIKVEYNGGMDALLGADWTTIRRNMATAKVSGVVR